MIMGSDKAKEILRQRAEKTGKSPQPGAPARPVSTTPSGMVLEDGKPGQAAARPKRAGPSTDSEVFRAFTGKEEEKSFADSRVPIEEADQTGKKPIPTQEKDPKVQEFEKRLAHTEDKNRKLLGALESLTKLVGELEEKIKHMGRNVARIDSLNPSAGEDAVTNVVKVYELDVEGSKLVHVGEEAPRECGIIDLKKLKRAPKVHATVKTVAPDIMEAMFSIVDAAVSQASGKFVTVEQLNKTIDGLNTALDRRFVSMARAVMDFAINYCNRLLGKSKTEKENGDGKKVG
jgi:hypothetical protein